MSRLPRPRFPDLISPAGAGLVAICFFLPWLRVSCGGKDATLSGAGIGGVFWLIFVLALAALAASFALRKKARPLLANSIYLASALISAGIIAYKYIAVARDPDIPFYVPSGMVHFEFRPGAIGVILGLALVAVGSFWNDGARRIERRGSGKP